MLRFSKKVEYALIAMMEMAEMQKGDQLVTAKSLARQYRIPQEIMNKVLQTLVRKGLLQSAQGVKGGYALAVSPEDYNILQIVEAVDGPLSIISCTHGKLCDCEQLIRCNIRTPMHVIQDELSLFFNGITLRDVKERYKKNFSIINFTRQPLENTAAKAE